MSRKLPTQHWTEELESLPEGVTLAEWALERQRWQNPRIRTLLGCITLISGVLESNYAILHCSPDRLVDIFARVREICQSLREKLTPLLLPPSIIPALEQERAKAQIGLEVLERTLLRRLDSHPLDDGTEELFEIRKLLCIAIGQINGYLQDTFGRIMAADPRSLHDADYYLSNRFPRDIEEAEWLYTTVGRLSRYIQETVEPSRQAKVVPFAEPLRDARLDPDAVPWPEILLFLGEVKTGLVPKLKEILALRGIRFAEMEVLDRYAEEIPSRLMAIQELHEARLHLSAMPGQETAGLVLAVRIGRLLSELNSFLKDLHSFLPLWLSSIEERRALLLRRD